MCIPTVPDWHTGVKPPGESNCDIDYQDERDRIPGWNPFENRAARRRNERARARARVTPPRKWSPLAGEARNVPAALHKSPHFGRRAWSLEASPRKVILSPNFRDLARHLLGQAFNCRSRWIAMTRVDVRESGDREMRMVCAQRCKTRQCGDCEGARRARQCARVAGQWGLFFTLTWPQAHLGNAEIWEQAHGAIGVFVRELRREMAHRSDHRIRKTLRGEVARVARAERSRARIECEDKLEYAWALESHESGFPHVHMCINATWLDYSYVRELWSRACGVMVARINGRRVWSVDGICRYLSKYVSKGGLELAILAILYRRRLWACTLRNIVKSESKWIPDPTVSSRDAREECLDRATFGARFGWKVEMGSDDEYAVWSRPLRLAQPRTQEDAEKGQFLDWRVARYLARRRRSIPDLEHIKECVEFATTREAFWQILDDDLLDRVGKLCYNAL